MRAYGCHSSRFSRKDSAGAAAYSALPIARDRDGTAYLALQEDEKILAVTPGGQVTTIAGHASELAGRGNDGLEDGPGAGAGFYLPQDLALAPDHSLLVAEPAGGRLRRIGLDDPSHPVTTLLGQRELLELDDKPGVDRPAGVAVDPAGRILIADEINRRVKEVGRAR